MRRHLLASGLAAIVCLAARPAANACGDKLLAVGRGVRFQRFYAAKRPGTILIYLGRNPNSAPGKEPDLQSTLKSAGHKLQFAEDASRLDRALREGRPDLVLADYADAAAMAQQAQAAPSKPIVLPMMYKPSKAEFAAAGKTYGFVLKAPSQAGEYLVTIDEAMKRREQHAR